MKIRPDSVRIPSTVQPRWDFAFEFFRISHKWPPSIIPPPRFQVGEGCVKQEGDGVSSGSVRMRKEMKKRFDHPVKPLHHHRRQGYWAVVIHGGGQGW